MAGLPLKNWLLRGMLRGMLLRMLRWMLRGNVSGLTGDVSGLTGDVDDADLSPEDRHQGVAIQNIVGE